MNTKLIVETQNAVTTLILNRPEVHNAFDDELIAELLNALQTIEKNPQTRVVILKANGKNFSAGADLNWMHKMVRYTEAENKQDALQLAQLMHRLYTLNKPIIAVVQGAAYGGAIGLIACCDIAIAADNANFCLSEVKIGLIPAVISPYLIHAIGAKQTQRYALTAETFDAQTAKRLGLINEVVPLELLEPQTQQLISTLLQNSPSAIQKTKALLHEVTQSRIDSTLIEKTAIAIAEARVSKEGQERLAAFLEKRT